MDIDEYRTLSSKDLQIIRQNLLGSVYRNTLMQLSICQKNLRLKTYIPSKCYRKSSEKFKSIHSIKNDISKTENEHSVHILDNIKLDKELDIIQNIFHTVLKELYENDNDNTGISVITKEIDKLKINDDEVNKLTEELQTNRLILEKYKETYEIDKKNGELMLKDTSKKLKDLRYQERNEKFLHQMEIKLIEKYTENRNTQINICMETKQRNLIQQLLTFNHRLSGEKRLGLEVQIFRKNELYKLKQQYIYWQQKYDEEINKMFEKNRKINERISYIVQCHRTNRDRYNQYIEYINDYLTFKAEQQLLYKQQCHRNKNAIRIQAWWRGIMVRCSLGKYRKKRLRKTMHKK